MARRPQVSFDASNPHELAAWWAELLGYVVEDNHDAVAGLLDQGIISEDDVVRLDGRLFFAQAVAASDPDGAGARLFFQGVPEGKVAKNRVHLDVPVSAEDLEAEAERLCAHGASLVEYRSYPGHRWAVMTDPEDNEFCLH